MAKPEASSVKWTSLLDKDYLSAPDMHRAAVDVRLATERQAVIGVCAVSLYELGTTAYLSVAQNVPHEAATHFFTGIIGGILGGLTLLRNANQHYEMLTASHNQ